jgi:methylthioribose-1-phosphate isomerase
LQSVLGAAEEAVRAAPQVMRQRVLKAAQDLAEADVRANRAIGQYGAALIRDGDTVLHHCNTGALATVDFGTALGVIRAAHEKGTRLHVLVDETRPRLQGARLTAWELQQYGIPFEIIPDAAAGHFLRRGEVASVFVGADRVAANGDVANKIGTYMLALAARESCVPFYSAFPTSTVDLNLPCGEAIPIEERNEAEVLDLALRGQPIAPSGSRARNPAFDITPHKLISAFITEVGILRPPFWEALRQAVEEASAQ